MTDLIVLHEDALGDDHPIYNKAPKADRVYIWDDEYFQSQGYGFKRLMFIYESLCALKNITIYHGNTIEIISELIKEKGIDTLYTPATNNQNLLNLFNKLNNEVKVKYIDKKPFVILKKEPDLKRFFRYWKKAEQTALQKNAGED